MRLPLALCVALVVTPCAAQSKAEVATMVRASAYDHGVPADLALGVAKVESDFDPNCQYHGSRGVMQVLLSTARSLGYTGPASGLYDAPTGIEYGMRYLKYCLDKRGSWEGAAACYNGTESTSTAYVRKVISATKSSDLIGKD